MAGERLRVRSPELEGGVVPVELTCDGSNQAPHLSWNRGPEGTKSYVLLVDDPDAPHPHFVHWLVWGMGPDQLELDPDDLSGVVQGVNGFGRLGWGGPCPPRGHGPHGYVFRVCALDCELHLEHGSTREALEVAMSGHVLMYGELHASYERRSSADEGSSTQP